MSIISRHGDALLHGLASLFGCAVLVWATTPWGWMVLANGFFWLGREWAQSVVSKNPKNWSRHKHIEWILPVVVGTISSYVSHRYL